MLGAKDWSYTGELNKELAKHNKENLGNIPVEAMANLQNSESPFSSKLSKYVVQPSVEDPNAHTQPLDIVKILESIDSLKSLNANWCKTRQARSLM